MTIIKWLHLESVLSMHDQQIMIHGGKDGVRDEGLLESALARPQNIAAYGNPDLCELAAAYAFGVASNHPFIDGNKRTAFLAAFSFLYINGWHLQATEVDAYVSMMALTQKEVDEKTFAAWLKKHSTKKKKIKK